MILQSRGERQFVARAPSPSSLRQRVRRDGVVEQAQEAEPNSGYLNSTSDRSGTDVIAQPCLHRLKGGPR
jgi:hypothetical protein